MSNRETTWREYMVYTARREHEAAEAARVMSGMCTTACSGDRAAIAAVDAELKRRYPTRT